MLAIEVQWQIFIKNLGGRTITLGVSSWYKILDVKFMIRDIEGIDPSAATKTNLCW
jgi:hypothetical protein